MEPLFESCGELDVIYYPAKKRLRVLPYGELLSREQLLTVREVLFGERREQVCGSLLVRQQAERLSLDWGSVYLEVGERTVSSLREVLFGLDLIEPQPQAIFFYEVEGAYGGFSNCSPYGIELDGQWWQTTEHSFQAQKFVHPSLQAMIRGITSAKEAAKRGRDRSLPLRPDWEKVKDGLMYAAVRQKFETHEDLRRLLLETGERELIEDAPNDYYWGCGADGSRRNRLGQILQEVRSRLQEQASQKG